MALVLADRVQETSTSPGGTGTLNLSGTAPAGFKTFSSGIGTGNSTYYCIFDTVAYDWEVGIGTYTSGSPGTLSRTTVLSNSAGTTSAISFTNGNTLNIFCTYPSEKSVNLDSSGNVSALGTISSGTWQGSTVGVAYGGTGVTASSGANSVVLRDADQNISVNSVTQNLNKVTSAGGTTTLTAASNHFQVLTGTSAQTFKLPDATSLPVGSTWVFDNDSTGNLTVTDYANGSVDVVAAGGYSTVVLEANGTVAGEWLRYGMIPNEVNWGTNSLALGGSTIVSGGTWQGNPIAYNYGGTGLTTFTAANYALYSTSASALTAGTLPVAAGGTGATTLTANGIVYGNGTSAAGVTAAGTTGQVLVGNTGAAPSWATVSSSLVSSFSAGTTGFTPSTATTGAITLAGTLNVANGGTGLTSLTAGYIPYGNGTSAFSSSSAFNYTSSVLYTPSASLSGNLIFTGTGNRITGDFSNATIANRVMFQNSVTNGNTSVGFIPNGTATTSILNVFNNSDPTNSSGLNVSCFSTEASLRSIITGTGTYVPLTIYTGGSERLRIDTSGNVGIGTSSPASRLDILGQATIRDTSTTTTRNEITASSDVPRIDFVNSGTYTMSVGYRGASAPSVQNIGQINVTANSPLALYTNNTERMRIDSSGNVGIGTGGNPSVKLDVRTASGTNCYQYLYGGGASDLARLYFLNNTSNVYIGNTAAGNVLDFNGKMTLDSSGNLGLGVTPSAWSAGGKIIEIGNAGNILFGAFNDVILSANAYYNTGWKYGGNNYASYYEQNSGKHIWYNAPVGTAGAAISFTQAMTLDASGRLGIGSSSTSPAVPLDVTGSAYLRSGGSSVSLQFGPTVGTGDAGIYYDVSGSFSVNSRTSYPLLLSALGSTYTAFNTNGSERMRLDSSGNLGLGVTPSAWGSPFKPMQLGQGGFISGRSDTYTQVHVGANSYFNGTDWIYTSTAAASRHWQSAGVHYFDRAASGTAGTAVTWTTGMTLDASGNLGIGTTSPGTKLDVYDASSTGNTTFLRIRQPNLLDGVSSKQISFGYNDTTYSSSFAFTPNYVTPASNKAHWQVNGSTFVTLDGSGNVGIGTSSPSQLLSIASSAAAKINIKGYSAATGIFVGMDSATDAQIWNSQNGFMRFATNDTERVRISAAGGFSVGTTADPGAGAIYATGSITANYSDDRLKTKLGGIENALDKVKSLSGFYYEANQTAQDLGYQPVREVGVSAQQVQAVLPEVVKPAPIDQQYLTVQYERIIPLLIEAIKELEAQVADLKKGAN